MRGKPTLDTTLYLYDEVCDQERLPLKYWPKVRMDNDGAYYSPGRGILEEKLEDVGRLGKELVDPMGSTVLSHTVKRGRAPMGRFLDK